MMKRRKREITVEAIRPDIKDDLLAALRKVPKRSAIRMEKLLDNLKLFWLTDGGAEDSENALQKALRVLAALIGYGFIRPFTVQTTDGTTRLVRITNKGKRTLRWETQPI